MFGNNRSDKSMKGKKAGKAKGKKGRAAEPGSAKGYTDYYVIETPSRTPETADEPRDPKKKRILFWVVAVLVALVLIGAAGPIGLGIVVGVGLWFFMRYLWRKRVSSPSEGKLVRDIKKKFTPKQRKILAGAVCVVVGVIFMSLAFASQERQDAQQAQSESDPSIEQHGPEEQLDLEVGETATFDGYSVTIQSAEYDGEALGAAFRIVALEDASVDVGSFAAKTEAGDAIETASVSPSGTRPLDRGEVLDGKLAFEDGQVAAILWTDGANRASWKLPAADPEPAATGTLTAHFIDVGQGDSSFYQLPDGKTMLVDAGTTESGSTVVSYLRGLGVERIDYLVATHPHEDHIGGMPAVFSAFEIGQVWAPRATHDTQCYEDFLNAVASEGLTIQAAEAGKQVCSGGGCTVQVTAPAQNADPEDLNDWSAVLLVTFGDTSLLLTGDAGTDVVDGAVSDSVDVLKVGHHGSETSTTAALASKLAPRISIISCGAGNDYGHPDQSVLDALASSTIYRTDLNGTVVVTSDGASVTATPAREADAAAIATGPETAAAQAAAEQQAAEAAASEQEAAAAAAAAASSSDNSDITVYVTNTGSKYHAAGCRHLRKSQIPMTLSEAKAAGYTPCGTCNPPA